LCDGPSAGDVEARPRLRDLFDAGNQPA
jgi:hypothetical protein